MRRKKEIKPVEPQSRTEPTTPALEALAKLPEKISSRWRWGSLTGLRPISARRRKGVRNEQIS